MISVDLCNYISTPIILPSNVKGSIERSHCSEQLFTSFLFTNTEGDGVSRRYALTVIVSVIVGFRNVSIIQLYKRLNRISVQV